MLKYEPIEIRANKPQRKHQRLKKTGHADRERMMEEKRRQQTQRQKDDAKKIATQNDLLPQYFCLVL